MLLCKYCTFATVCTLRYILWQKCSIYTVGEYAFFMYWGRLIKIDTAHYSISTQRIQLPHQLSHPGTLAGSYAPGYTVIRSGSIGWKSKSMCRVVNDFFENIADVESKSEG